MAQFDRIYRLTVGVEGSDGIVIEAKPYQQGLSLGFDIDKDLTQQTNTRRVQVLNLSMATAKKLARDDRVRLLEAGYSEAIGLRRIFVGEGMLIGAAGPLGGLCVGLAFALAQQRFGFIKMGAASFLVDAYPVAVQATDIVAIAATALAVTWLINRLTVARMIPRTAIRCNIRHNG